MKLTEIEIHAMVNTYVRAYITEYWLRRNYIEIFLSKYEFDCRANYTQEPTSRLQI